jgi:hypothetical protein
LNHVKESFSLGGDKNDTSPCSIVGDCHLRDIHYVKPHELEGPHGNPSRGEAVSDNFPKPMLYDHLDRVTFKIVQELVFCNQNGVKQFLHLIVVGFTVGQDFADLVDRPLYLVDVSGFLSFHYQGCADNLGCCHNVEKEGFT